MRLLSTPADAMLLLIDVPLLDADDDTQADDYDAREALVEAGFSWLAACDLVEGGRA